MKRLLHALAALWPKKRATGSPPLGDPSTAIPQHLTAVLRMEGILGECADLRICKSANETLGAGALNTVRDQLTESSAQQLTESPDTRLTESPDTRLPESSAQQLNESPDTRLIESPDTRLTESPDTRLDDSPNQQIVESPNQPQSLPRIPQPMPLLTILMMVFFMCLMAAKQVSAQAEPAEAVSDFSTWTIPKVISKPLANGDEERRISDLVPDADLGRYPMMIYSVETDSGFSGLGIGDSIPNAVWNLPLWVANHPHGKDTIRLREYKNQSLLVLDFWASWCAPCVESMDKWEYYKMLFGSQVSFLGVHLDYDYKALPFSTKRKWTSPSIIGGSARVLARCFFLRNTASRLVWIANGRLVGITGAGGYDASFISDVLEGKEVRWPLEFKNSYMPATNAYSQEHSKVFSVD